MCNDTNDFLQCLCEFEEWVELERKNSIQNVRFRNSKLQDYRLEILQKKAAGKSFQQIADYLLNIHAVKCDRSTIFDFYMRCINE